MHGAKRLFGAIQFLCFFEMDQKDTVLLTARGNAHIKRALCVRKSARTRKETGLFFLEGARLCADAAASGTEIAVLFYTDKASVTYADRVGLLRQAARESFRVSGALAEYLAETENPQGVFCLCAMRAQTVSVRPDGRYIALSFVQNPDNLGAVSRTAEAFGVDGLILEGGCDPYNPKAQRAAMGSLLRLPIVQTDDLDALLQTCRANGMRTYAATPDSTALPVTRADFSGGAVCIVGNEGAGLRSKLLETCTRLTIPMRGRAESLNAAAAASVLLWEMMREATE